MSVNNKGLAIGGSAIGVGLLAVAAALFTRGVDQAPVPPAQPLAAPTPISAPAASAPEPAAAPVAAAAPAPVAQPEPPVAVKPKPKPRPAVVHHRPAEVAPFVMAPASEMDPARARETAAAAARQQQIDEAIRQAKANRNTAIANCQQQHQLGTGERIGWDAAAAAGGAVLGHQVGKGKGKTWATVLGAVAAGAGADYYQGNRAQSGYDACVNNANAQYQNTVSRYKGPGY